jgi:hypothetical protein
MVTVSNDLKRIVVKRKDGYHVLSEKKDKKGKRKNLGGPYATPGRTEHRLQEIEMFKHMGD